MIVFLKKHTTNKNFFLFAAKKTKRNKIMDYFSWNFNHKNKFLNFMEGIIKKMINKIKLNIKIWNYFIIFYYLNIKY